MGHRQGRTFDHVFVSPLDVPWAVRRAMGRLKPSVLVLEYTELWPQLIDGAKRAGVALALHNGRFGLGRLWRYRLLFALTGNLLRLLDLLLMRDEAQGARAIKLGARPSAVLVTGNTKFDNLHRDPDVGLVKEILEQTGWPASGGPILVYGSTHEGEEQLLLQTFAALQKDMPALKLIIAPRYPERAERVEGLCSRLGLVALLRCGGTPVIQGRADVLVLNTVGELAACYALGTAIFVGGSFVPRGGQNILEPAALAKPVVFGPHMHNFADAVAVLAGRGGIQVRTPQGLYRVLLDLLSHPKICADLGAIAQAQVKAVRGAAERNACHLMQLVHAQTPPRGAADP
jgi:3-deoxy-D-manno-octulosonic-acid transferase